MSVKYKRILLKLSGESLMGDNGIPIHPEKLNNYISQIKELVSMGVEVGIVIGGGNIFRGVGNDTGIDRISGDYMGMFATVINSIGLRSALLNHGVKARVLTAVTLEPVAERYSKQRADEALANKEVVIFSFGTGNPFFTTDTAAALRAVEIGAEALLKGTRVDGVYSADPEKDPAATRFESITFDEVIEKGLKVMDITAFTMCRDNKLPIVVFDINNTGNLKKIISGENIGTLVKN